MKSFLLSVLLLYVTLSSFAQEFEGKIFLISNSQFDTLYYTYTVKSKYIKIDEFNKQKRLSKSLIINTETNSIIAINPSKKLYTRIPVPEKQEESDEQGFDVIKTTNFKEINGYKCNLWRVRNKELNTDVSYWVAVDKFSFFDDLIRTLHTNDKYLSFFLKLPNLEGAMPMMSVERTLLRDEKCSLTVLEIDRKKIKDSMFTIPSDYKPFDIKY